MQRLGLTSDDVIALNEVRTVLVKHGLEEKFGIRLNHTHFAMHPNEVMHETNDSSNRVLTVIPKDISRLPESAFASQWYFDKNGAIVVDQYCCDPPEAK